MMLLTAGVDVTLAEKDSFSASLISSLVLGVLFRFVFSWGKPEFLPVSSYPCQLGALGQVEEKSNPGAGCFFMLGRGLRRSKRQREGGAVCFIYLAAMSPTAVSGNGRAK